MVTVKADDKRRVVLPGIEAGQVFAYELAGNVVKLTPLKPDVEDVPLVHLVQGPDGFWQLPEGVKLSREEIRAAIRADRDSR